MLGASEKIALLSRQNEALLHVNKMLDQENTELRERCHQLENEMADLKTSLPIAVPSSPSPSSAPSALSSSQATEEGKANPPPLLGDPNAGRASAPAATAVMLTASPQAGESGGGGSSSGGETINEISRCQQQILFLAKHGEKDLSHGLGRCQAEYEQHQAHLQQEESLLRDLSSEYELLQSKSTSASSSAPSSTRQTLERALSIPSSLGRLASRLSIVATSATTTAALAASSQQETPPSQPPAEESSEPLTLPASAPADALGPEDTPEPLEASSSGSGIESLQKKLEDLRQEISLQEAVCVEKRRQLHDLKKVQEVYSKETNSLRQIILFLDHRSTATATAKANSSTSEAQQERGQESHEEGEGDSLAPPLVPNSETLWAMKNLNLKNAALTEELRSVKQRFSSVIGRMEGFSLSKFTMNVLGGDSHSSSNGNPDQLPQGPQGEGEEAREAPDGEREPMSEGQTGLSTSTVVETAATSTPAAIQRAVCGDPFDDAPVELLFPSPSSPPATAPAAATVPLEDMTSAMASEAPEESSTACDLTEKWTPAFVCAVSQWSRKSRREVVFILRVRNVGTDIRDWSVVKSFPECKALRMKLKPFISSTPSSSLPPLSFPSSSSSSAPAAAIDNLFPADAMTLFSISDDVAEERKEALNSYLVALCSGSHISLGSSPPLSSAHSPQGPGLRSHRGVPERGGVCEYGSDLRERRRPGDHRQRCRELAVRRPPVSRQGVCWS
jgi:hypothetical protein